MKKLFYVAMVCTALAMTSCATLFCGSTKRITLTSNVPVKSATLTVDGRKFSNVTFPYVVSVKRGFRETAVKAETPDYAPTTLLVDKTFNPVAVLNLFNILPWAIDIATGAMMQPEFDYYELEFTKP